MFCSLLGSNCFLLGIFSSGRKYLVRKKGCLAASWPARGCCALRLRHGRCVEKEAGIKESTEEQRAREQIGNLSFQNFLMASFFFFLFKQ